MELQHKQKCDEKKINRLKALNKCLALRKKTESNDLQKKISILVSLIHVYSECA